MSLHLVCVFGVLDFYVLFLLRQTHSGDAALPFYHKHFKRILFAEHIQMGINWKYAQYEASLWHVKVLKYRLAVV